MYYIQIGKVEMPEFIITTNVDEKDGYTYVEAPKFDINEEHHVY